jgi:hypothetical protein
MSVNKEYNYGLYINSKFSLFNQYWIHKQEKHALNKSKMRKQSLNQKFDLKIHPSWHKEIISLPIHAMSNLDLSNNFLHASVMYFARDVHE